MTRARVLLLTAALGPLDYRVPHGSDAPLGSVVVVPLGPRRMGGVVWEAARLGPPGAGGANRLRNLSEVVPVPPVPGPWRKLGEWPAWKRVVWRKRGSVRVDLGGRRWR